MVWAGGSGAFMEVYSQPTGGGVRYTAGSPVFLNPFLVIITDDGTAAADALKIYQGDMSTPKATGTTKWVTVSQLNLCLGTAGVGAMRGSLAELALFYGAMSGPDRIAAAAYASRYGL
jgi:hypothetical protein